MLPCVGVFMKRRRTKDYLNVLNIMYDSARNNVFNLNLGKVMINFEMAAKKAFETAFKRRVRYGLFNLKSF